MDNVDKFIESLVNSGKSLDDIGRELSDALNRKQNEINKAEQRKRELRQRREGLVDNICAALDTDAYPISIAASAATITAIDRELIKSKEEADAHFAKVMDLLHHSGDKAQPTGSKSNNGKSGTYFRATAAETSLTKILQDFAKMLG